MTERRDDTRLRGNLLLLSLFVHLALAGFMIGAGVYGACR